MVEHKCLILTIIFLVAISVETEAKLLERSRNQTNGSVEPKISVKTTRLADIKPPRKPSDAAAILFVDELKVTLDRYLFGICPQTFKYRWSPISLERGKNASTHLSCDLDTEQQDLAGRLATLALRAHAASRADCSRLSEALASTLGELAQTAADRQEFNAAAANTEANKKRKLSKSQKAKLQAKQRTAVAVKKKAAAAAAKPVSA